MIFSIKHFVSFWVGAAMFLLAYALLDFSKSLHEVNTNVPEFLSQVSTFNENIGTFSGETVPDFMAEINTFSQKIDTISKTTVPSVLRTIPQITNGIDGIRQQIPTILDETSIIRNQTIPEVLKTVNTTNSQIPHMFARVDSIQKMIPEITSTIQKTNLVTEHAIVRIDSINTQIPDVLDTITETNDSIYNYLSRAELLTNSAGRKVSQGFLLGLITSPFHAVKGVGNFVFGKKSKISERDAIDAEIKVLEFLNDNSDLEIVSWIGDDSQIIGSLEVLDSYTKRSKKIKKVKVSFDEYNESITVSFFQKEDGKWSYWK